MNEINVFKFKLLLILNCFTEKLFQLNSDSYSIIEVRQHAYPKLLAWESDWRLWMLLNWVQISVILKNVSLHSWLDFVSFQNKRKFPPFFNCRISLELKQSNFFSISTKTFLVIQIFWISWKKEKVCNCFFFSFLLRKDDFLFLIVFFQPLSLLLLLIKILKTLLPRWKENDN